jgi:hypothetical protein
MMNRFFGVMVVLWFVAGVAHAERYVVVNGQRLSQGDIFYFEQLRCGPIANGNYVYDQRTGMWAYPGDRQWRGHISDNCRNPEPRPGLSERGMLFAPGELAR